jgi:hypothetical protein
VVPSQVVPQSEHSHCWPASILSSPIQGDSVVVTPAAAIRSFVLGSVDAIRAIAPEN